jgi:uncharacterized BrkB/YihY/UPF0761 family membrane protein
VAGLLTWVLIAAEITLVAAEVNVVLARRLFPRSVAGELRLADNVALRDSGQGRATGQPRTDHRVATNPRTQREANI